MHHTRGECSQKVLKGDLLNNLKFHFIHIFAHVVTFLLNSLNFGGGKGLEYLRHHHRHTIDQ